MNSLKRLCILEPKQLKVTFSKQLRLNQISITQCNISDLTKKKQKTPSNLRKAAKLQTDTELHSILPPMNDINCSEISNIQQKLDKLNSLISEVNLKIAEQQELFSIEEQDMLKQYGTPLLNKLHSFDPDCPHSKYPCVGCGALLQCCHPYQPGFISSGRFKALSNLQKQNSKCIRCRNLEDHNVMLNAGVSPEMYRQMLSQIRDERSLILHIVDVTDYRNSMITDLLDIVGTKHPIYIIGNKIDLLPKDSNTYLNHIEHSLANYATEIYGDKVKYVGLTSALTGYGIERLVTKIFNHAYQYHSHLHLVGCTNSGKSSLFNTLLGTDLCRVSARDKIGKATVSIWPGTTLNLLKFPIRQPSRYTLALRAERLKQEQKENNNSNYGAHIRRNVSSLTLKGPVEVTHLPEDDDVNDDAMNWAFDNVAYDTDIDCHYRMNSKRVVENRDSTTVVGSLNYKQFGNGRWLYDTPGLINNHQIINHIGVKDLKRLLMKRMTLPRTFILSPAMSLFIGGVARMDYVKAEPAVDKEQKIFLTVVAAGGLPISVVNTEEADIFYQQSLKEDKLRVPSSESSQHMAKLIGETFTIAGAGLQQSQSDIQLSSVGWVAVCCPEGTRAVLKAYTPGGVGCYVRPSLLPYAVLLKGKRIRGTRAFTMRKPVK